MRLMLHAHTTYSRDGTLSVAELAALAARRGFAAVLLSDHFEHLDAASFAALVEECAAQSDTVMVPGYERSWAGYHLCAFGVRDWHDGPDLLAWADAVRASGGLVCVVHPARYKFVVPPEVLAACDAVEVWNSKRPYDGVLGPNPAAFDLVGERLPLAGQDFHRRLDASSVAVELDALAGGGEIIAALQARRYRIASRCLRFRTRPPGWLDPLLRLWQGLRPLMWAAPVATYHALRRLARRLRR